MSLLCLNLIVKDEGAKLERCLAALADHIGGWVVVDAGSTDGTPDLVRSFFAARRLPGELHRLSFDTVEQARNEALARARASPLTYDYLLFADAGLELVVEDRGFRSALKAPAYRLMQRADGGLSNWNIRLLERGAAASYRGVTHQDLEVSGEVGQLAGVWFRDHAGPAGRAEKAERDIGILTAALEHEPGNARYWYDLAQSYRDAGRVAEAARAYARRADMGGAAEEAWSARLEAARCLLQLGDEGGFLRQAITAYNQRPHRAEPLYDLARFYRVRELYAASVLFSEPALDLPRPAGDLLRVEDFVYGAGLKEEYSIAANYARDPARKERGRQACDWLSLQRDIPAHSRNQARFNLRFYACPAAAIMPSFAARPVGFTPPGGFRPTNPSVARWGERIVMVERCVNYVLDSDGVYHKGDDASPQPRNYLLTLDAGLEVRSADAILPPLDLPTPRFAEVGPADLRPFVWRDALWCVGHIRELTQSERWVNQMLARIDDGSPDAFRLVDWRMLRPGGPRLIEKNWMPQIVGDELRFLYLCDPTRVLDDQARLVAETEPAIAAEDFRGGTQAVAFDGGWLVLIHQVGFRHASARLYFHRFVWFDRNNVLRRVSRQFYFREQGVEFAAGMAWHPDGRRLLISYGINDGESVIADVAAEDVGAVLEDVRHIPWGGTPRRSP